MKHKYLAAVLCASLLLSCLAGCGSPDTGTDTASSSETEESTDAASGTEEADFTLTDADLFTDRDSRTAYDESECVRIQLNGDSATADSDSVEISGSTITITEEASYLISGTLDDGMLIVNAPDTAKLQLIFDGVTINSETSAPLYIPEADKVFLTLAEGTENTLSNGGSFTAIDDNNIDAVIFSKQDLTLNGSGTLTVTSPSGHGVVSKDDLKITGGTYTISAASQGLGANDSIRITGKTALTIDAGKDGLHAENDEDASLGYVYISGGTLDIEAEGDGISAGSWLHITDGDVRILAGGGSENAESSSSDSWGDFPGGGGQPGGMPGNTMEMPDEDSGTSMKGIKAAGDLRIAGGSFTIDSADDAIHSNSCILVDGGSFEIASGDDAFHADDTLTVTACTVNISGCYEGLEALHVDIQGGDITLTASDDGLNAAGGTDASGTEGGRDGMFGGQPGGENPAGRMSSSNGSITISGGTLHITASGDGIDANGTIEITGGYTVVTGPTQGDTATLDYDTTATISGGTFIGTGASGMAQTFSDSTQSVVSVSAGEQTAGTEIILSDNSGNELLSFTPELSFNVIILSSPDLEAGETYTLTVGSQSGDVEA